MKTPTTRYRHWRAAAAFVFVVACLCVAGCPPPNESIPPDLPRTPRTNAEIIRTIEINNRLLDRALWSNSVTVKARFEDSDGKEHPYNLEGSFLFDRPLRLLIDLRPGLGNKVMQIGSNDDDYWFWIEPEVGVMRWGRHRHVGKPGVDRAGIRPDHLVSALGFADMRLSEQGLIGPDRVWGKTYDKLRYMRETRDGGFVSDREYHIDRDPPYLMRVVIFRDEFGRRVMSAFLDDYKPAWEGGPMVAHHINVDWPREKARFTMWLARVRGVEDIEPEAFARPTDDKLPAGVRDIVQIDAVCDNQD